MKIIIKRLHNITNRDVPRRRLVINGLHLAYELLNKTQFLCLDSKYQTNSKYSHVISSSFAESKQSKSNYVLHTFLCHSSSFGQPVMNCS